MKRVLKIPVYIIAVLLLTIFAAAYLFLFTTLPERELNAWIGYKALGKSGYDISFERMNRDLWDHLVLDGINISPKAGVMGPDFKINRIELKYDVIGLTKGHYSFQSIDIDTAMIELPPEYGPSRKEKKGDFLSLPLTVSAEKINIGYISVKLASGETVLIDEVSASAAAGKEGVRIEIGNISARWAARDLEIKKLSGNIASSENGFRLENLHLITGRSGLLLNGTLGRSLTADFDLSIGCEPINLEDIKKLTGVKISGELDGILGIKGSATDFSGQAALNGTFMEKPFEDISLTFSFRDKILSFGSVDGNIFHAGFHGSGEINFNKHPEEYSYEGLVKHLNLQEIAPDLKTDLTGTVTLSGQSFSVNNFRMQAICKLDSVRIERYFFNEASGTIVFDLEKIDFLPGLTARYKNTYLDAAGSLEYKGKIDISGKARFADLTDFRDQIFLRKLGGRGNAVFDVTGPTRDFTVDASFDSDSCWTYGLEPGQIHIKADLTSFINHRVGTITGRWNAGELYSVPVDSGFFTTSVSGEMAFIDSVRVFGLGGGIWFSGLYDGTQIPPLFKADTLYGDIFSYGFSSKEPIVVRIYDKETDIEKLKLGYQSGILEMQGMVTNDLDLGLDLTLSDFPIQSILEQIYPEKGIGGICSGTAQIRGNFEDPEMEFDMVLDSLNANRVPLGKLVSKATYSDGYLRTDSTILSSDYGIYKFSGRLPMNLSFGEVQKRFPDEPIDMRLTSSGKRLLLAEIFVDAVERYDTDFSFEMGLSGTYSKPKVSGTGTLTDGILKTQYIVNPFTKINAYFRMENEKIFIDSVSATMAEQKSELGQLLAGVIPRTNGNVAKPLITASGTITLLGINNFLYDLSVTGRNVGFLADAYDVSGLAGFNLRVEGETPPTIRGNISLHRLDIRDDFDKFVGADYDASVAAVEDSTLWDLDLYISAPNNIWIKNKDIDAEFKADIRVQRHVGILGELGTLEAIRGSYNVLGDRGYKFQSGMITYPDFATVDPRIDFMVIKQVRQRESGISEPLTMELHITGTLLVPKIDVPGYSKEEALKLLASSSWAARTLSGERSSEDYISGVSALATSMGLDPSTVQGIFEELDIGEFGSDKGPQISLAKYVSPNLYVRYSRRLKDPESTIGVEYYLNNNFSFRAAQGIKGSQNEGFSFDFNFNYEY